MTYTTEWQVKNGFETGPLAGACHRRTYHDGPGPDVIAETVRLDDDAIAYTVWQSAGRDRWGVLTWEIIAKASVTGPDALRMAQLSADVHAAPVVRAIRVDNARRALNAAIQAMDEAAQRLADVELSDYRGLKAAQEAYDQAVYQHDIAARALVQLAA